MLREELEPCLAQDAVPAPHGVRVHITNGLERLNQRLKRRTRVLRIIPNGAELLRLVTALAGEHSDEWVGGRREPDLESVEEAPGSATAVAQAA